MASRNDMSARDRLRKHFLANIGRVLNSEELREASGNISEWARRVRELRDEEGFQILTNNDLAELKPGQYRLDDPHPSVLHQSHGSHFRHGREGGHPDT
jgi:hypothetical protein